MKTLKLIIALLILGISANMFAQQQSNVPHAFKYQAVARDSKGDVISNQNVAFRISILQGSETGTVVYQETQTATTNQFGLAMLSIGKGNVTNGNFNDVQWGDGSYFVKIEFDPNGGTNYSLVSTSEMLSVPYAFYAEKTDFPIKAALVATNVAGPIPNPETGMLIYNTATSGTVPYEVNPGYYYNAGTASIPNWVPLSPNNTSSVNRVMGCANGNDYDLCSSSSPLGKNNTNFGWNTGAGIDKGTNNTNYGFDALQTGLNEGSSNTAIGANALANTSESWNTAVGDSAMYANTTGEYCTAVGYKALSASTTATSVTAVGYEALFNSTGANNTAVGLEAMKTNTSGIDNVAVGYTSLYTNSTGNYNVAVGLDALYNSTSNNNVGIGYNALQTVTTGANNTAVGYQADVAATNLTNATAIGNGASVGSSNMIQLGNSSVVALESSGNRITYNPSLAAINSTATATAAQIVSGYITSTSAAATTITLPTASSLASQIAGSSIAVAQGTSLCFTVDNVAGANTVTIAVNTGITTLGTVTITGEATLTVASGNLGIFKIVFTSASAAKLIRIS